MHNDVEKYELYLAATGADDQELDQERLNLQRELNDLEDVDDVEQISAGSAPENTRALDLIVIGGLALALKKSGAFDAVVTVLKVWIDRGTRRQEKRKVVIKRSDGTVLEFDGYSLKDIESLRTLPATDK